MSLHLTGGEPEDTHLGENLIWTFQLRVRSRAFKFSEAEAKWFQAYQALHNADLSANGIRLITALSSGPLHFTDDKNRPNFTSNFRVVFDKPQP
jgi:hypothetical protein